MARLEFGFGRAAQNAVPKEQDRAGIAAAAAFLEALPEPVALVDPTGETQWINARFAELFEIPAGAARGIKVQSLAGPYALQAEGTALLDAVHAGVGHLEFTAFSRSGEPFPALARVGTVHGHGALRLLTVCDQTDVERLRADIVLKAETTLKEREVLRATAEALDTGVLVADDSERIVLVNAAARQILGLESESMQGHALTELPVPSSVRGAWFTFLASHRDVGSQTVRVGAPGSERTLLLRMARANSPRGIPLASVLVVRDLTRFVDPDRRKYDFIAQLSHEMRTPLASVQGFVTTLLVDPDLDRELRNEFCTIVLDEARRLADLVESLLELAQLDSGRLLLERRTVDLVALVRETAAVFAKDARTRGTPIELALPEQAVSSFVDSEKLRGALARVLANAIEHGGSEHGIRVAVQETGSTSLEIAVRDWGPGVPPEDLEAIFDPFFRVLRPGVAPTAGGTGMGLALCRQLVERHGGSVHAELPGDGGLRVVLSLPHD